MSNKNRRAKSIRMLNQILASPRHLNVAAGIVTVSDRETQAYAEQGAEMGIAMHYTTHWGGSHLIFLQGCGDDSTWKEEKKIGGWGKVKRGEQNKSLMNYVVFIWLNYWGLEYNSLIRSYVAVVWSKDSELWSYFVPTYVYKWGSDSSVSIATGYGLNGPAIEWCYCILRTLLLMPL